MQRKRTTLLALGAAALTLAFLWYEHLPSPPSQEVTFSELDLRRAVVERTLAIENVVIQKLSAWNLTSNGLTMLKNVSITGEADLRGSRFMNLLLARLTWPALGTRKLQIAGMTYQSIAIEAAPASSANKVWNWLFARSPELDRLEHRHSDEGNYLQLERFLNQSGHKRLADKVYISMKRREIWPQKWYEWLNPVFWSTLIFWDVPVGYGRKPLRTIWFALAFILVGAYFFDPRYLEGVDQPRRNISRRLLLSVDKFIPFMFDLGIESKWHPTSLPISVRIYNWIHKLTARGFWPSFSSARGRILNKQSFHGKVDVIHHCHPKKYPHQEGVMCHQSLKGLVPGNGFLPSKKQIAGRTEISGDQPGRESFPHSSSHCHDRIGQNSQSRNNWRKQKCPILDMFLFRIPILVLKPVC